MIIQESRRRSSTNTNNDNKIQYILNGQKRM